MPRGERFPAPERCGVGVWASRGLARLLNTPAGRYAELAVITELLDAAEQGINRELTEPLRRRAASILERHDQHLIMRIT